MSWTSLVAPATRSRETGPTEGRFRDLPTHVQGWRLTSDAAEDVAMIKSSGAATATVLVMTRRSGYSSLQV
jgi:hypothetical protein